MCHFATIYFRRKFCSYRSWEIFAVFVETGLPRLVCCLKNIQNPNPVRDTNGYQCRELTSGISKVPECPALFCSIDGNFCCNRFTQQNMERLSKTGQSSPKVKRCKNTSSILSCYISGRIKQKKRMYDFYCCILLRTDCLVHPFTVSKLFKTEH